MAKKAPKSETPKPQRRRNARTRTAAVATPEEEDDDEENADFEVSDAEAAVRAEFGDAGSDDDWKIMVYRLTGSRTGPKPYLFTCAPDDLPIIDRLRDGYGSGNYLARCYRNNRIWKNIQYAVEATPGGPRQEVLAPHSGAGDTAAMLGSFMQRSDERFVAMMERLAPAQPVDRMADTLAMITAMREAFGTPAGAAPGVSPADILNLVREGITLAQDVGAGEQRGAGGLIGIVSQLLESPLVKSLLASGMPGAVPPGGLTALPQPVQGAAPQQPPQPQQQPQPAPSEQERATALLVGNLAYLVTKAAQNGAIDLYADWTMDNIPRDVLQQICALPDPVGELAKLNPGVAAHHGWFAALVADITELLTAPESGGNPAPDVRSAP